MTRSAQQEVLTGHSATRLRWLPLLAGALPLVDRFENATEWWGGLVFTLFFGMIAFLWRRTGYAMRTALTR
jgi:hypothetical protein